jgi:excisionase family DNA binding protein
MLSVTQAAEIAGYDPGALRRVIEVGKLPATKIAGVWIVNRNDLDQWMSSDNFRIKAGRPKKNS